MKLKHKVRGYRLHKFMMSIAKKKAEHAVAWVNGLFIYRGVTN